MNNTDYNRFFDLVGNEAVEYSIEQAKISSEKDFVKECMSLVVDNPEEYELVKYELLSLSYDFWLHIQMSM